MPEVVWRLRADPPGKGVVAGERHGLFTPTTSRLVLDMRGPFTLVRQAVEPPARGRTPTTSCSSWRRRARRRPRHRRRAQHPRSSRPAPRRGRSAPSVAAPPPAVTPQQAPHRGGRAAPDRAPHPSRAAAPAEPAPATAAEPAPAPPVPRARRRARRGGVRGTRGRDRRDRRGLPAPSAGVAAAVRRRGRERRPAAKTDVALVVPPPPPQVASPGLPTIVIDPGHGGVDPGTIGVGGMTRRTSCSGSRARSARDRGQRPLPRGADPRRRQFIAPARPDRDRARGLGGDLFISLHADSLRLGEHARRLDLHALRGGSDDEAARLASKENKADILAGTDLSEHDAVVASILIDLAQRDTNNHSIAFADLLAEELGKVTPLVHQQPALRAGSPCSRARHPLGADRAGLPFQPGDARNLSQPSYPQSAAPAIVLRRLGPSLRPAARVLTIGALAR